MDNSMLRDLSQLMLAKLEAYSMPVEISAKELLAEVLEENASLVSGPLTIDDASALDGVFKQLVVGCGYFVSATAAASVANEASPLSIACIYHKVEDLQTEFSGIAETVVADLEADIACYAKPKEVETRYGGFSAFLVRVPSGKTTGVRFLRHSNTLIKVKGNGFIEYMRNRTEGCKFMELDGCSLVLNDCSTDDVDANPWFRLKNTGDSDLVVLVEKCSI